MKNKLPALPLISDAHLTAGIVAVVLIIVGAIAFTALRKGNLGDYAFRQKVSAQSDLHFSFPVEMNHRSVEEKLSSIDDVKGAYTWDDEVLVLKPVSPLEAKKSYTFLLPSDVKKHDGNVLARNLEYVFTVAGPPTIAARIPLPDAINIKKTSKITIVFDRPMVPLTQIQGDYAKDDPDAPWPVTIDPPVKGRWRWLSTVAREFIPETNLTDGTRYTVTMKSGIPSVNGDETTEDFTWSFETERPEIAHTEPKDLSMDAGPTTRIALTFNHAMNPKSAEKLLTLFSNVTGVTGTKMSPDLPMVSHQAPEGTLIAIKSVTYGVKNVKGKNVTDTTTLVITPAQPFAFHTSYALYGKPGILATEGDLGTVSGFTLKFNTVGPLSFVEGKYLKDSNQLSIQFNNPIDKKSLKESITIAPSIEKAKEFDWSINEWAGSNLVYGYPILKASTTYTVTVGKGMKDIYGQVLGSPYTFSFTTPQITPRVFINSKGEFGIFEKSKSPIYYLNSINVSELNLEFAKVPLDAFLASRLKKNADYNAFTDISGFDAHQTWTLKPKAKKNEWNVIPFDVKKEVSADLAPGIYALHVRAPEYKKSWPPYDQMTEVQYFTITNLAITLKYSGDHALVWVTDMENGDPVRGAKVSIMSLNGKAVRTGVTDQEGFFDVDLPSQELISGPNDWEPEFWVTAETDNDMAFVGNTWGSGIRPYDFGLPTEFRGANAKKYRVDSYVYTERPIYRAGDTVSFKGIVRLRDWNGAFSIPSDRKAFVSVRDAQGNEIIKKTVAINGFGSFNGTIPIDEKATLGDYFMTITLTPETDIQNNYIGASFSVLAYRKPEYKVDILTEKEDYFTGDAVHATVQGSYYFGAPMGQAHVSWRALSTDYYFNKVTDGWYSFSLSDTWCWYECSRQTSPIAQGEGTLDPSGKLDLSIPVDIADKALSQVLTIEADITDLNNQVVSNRTSVSVHKADAYVGIKTNDYAVEPGGSSSIDVITVKPDGSALPQQSVTLSLYSRTWNTVKKKSVDGEYYFDNEPKDTFLRSQSVETNEEGKASTKVTIPSGGQFRVVATVRDDAGREAKAGTDVYAWSESYVNWPHSNSDRMDLIPDKPEYKPGEKATLIMKSPYQGKGVKALITVEREGIMSKHVVDVTSSAQPIMVSIDDVSVPNVFVSAVVVKPRMGETFDENGLDTGAPAFKIGYAKLSVDTTKKRLTVAITTDKPQYGPGEKARVTITTKDADGKGVPSDVSLGVVDLSLLALSSFETPDLTRLFYSERGLGVYSSQMLTYLLERYKPGSKGGGGADPESRKRGNFVDTAYWNPTILTDANGTATVEFTLPDNLTTWQLLAIGSTKSHNFGSIAETILETKKVIVRPVRPRFAIQGDTINLGAIVHNFLPDTTTFTVTLKGKGFASDAATQKIALAKGAEAKLIFPATVLQTDSVTLNFTAEADGGRDEIEEKIPVYAFTTPQSVATTGIVETSMQEKVIIPTKRDAPSGTLTIAASPSLAAYLPKALGYLVQYPYGCTEQILSSFLPSIALSRLTELQATQSLQKKDLDDRVTKGLERIYASQRDDGGFGYFSNATESYPSLSAYVLFGLTVTKQSGFAVDQGVVNRVSSYLQNVLRKERLDSSFDLTLRTDIVEALAIAGRADASLVNPLFERRNELPLFSKAKLGIAYAAMRDIAKAKTIANELKNAARVDSRGTHFEENDDSEWGSFMNTADRTTALALTLFIDVDPDDPLIPNITRFLLTERENGHWDTTQSTTFALLAFADYLEATKELSANAKATINVNAKNVLSWNIDAKNVLERKEIVMKLDALMRGKENPIDLSLTGKGRLYYDLLLSYLYAGDTLPPAEEGIGITRAMQRINDGTAVTTPRVGETYVVTLTISVPEERRYVAVESPVPAGMEIIDLSLATAQKNLLSSFNDRNKGWDEEYWESGLWRFTHTEVRDDQFFLFAPTLPAGVYQYHYLVRATTPGTFHSKPARAYEMYFPEIFGQTSGNLMTIKE